MFDANKRKYPRANYPCQLTMWLANGSDETILANTSNIGQGGVCVHLNQGVDVGTKVDVQLNFAESSTPLRCKGVVVRSLRENEKFYNVGIQFEPLDELKSAFLNAQVNELIAQEQKGKS